jgi:hypothetical protein
MCQIHIICPDSAFCLSRHFIALSCWRFLRFILLHALITSTKPPALSPLLQARRRVNWLTVALRGVPILKFSSCGGRRANPPDPVDSWSLADSWGNFKRRSFPLWVWRSQLWTGFSAFLSLAKVMINRASQVFSAKDKLNGCSLTCAPWRRWREPW